MMTTSTITSTRFTIDALDPVDCLIGILVLRVSGDKNDKVKARSAYNQLKFKLSQADIRSLIPEPPKRAMALYFMRVLNNRGLKMDRGLAGKLTYCISLGTAGWRNLVLMERHEKFDAFASPSCDGYGYIMWKFGKSERPTTGDWAVVP
jgi:hypothetical protein